MTIQITIEVPDQLGQELQRFRDRLPELLERGLGTLRDEPSGEFQDAREIVNLLASRPTPEQILAIQPSAEFQARVNDLLAQCKTGTLSRVEESELERYLMLEHLTRLAKARALEEMKAAA